MGAPKLGWPIVLLEATLAEIQDEQFFRRNPHGREARQQPPLRRGRRFEKAIDRALENELPGAAEVHPNVAVACRLRLDRLLGGFLCFKLDPLLMPCLVVRWPELTSGADLLQVLRDDCFLQRHL
eukprot:4331971-Prymnesium_polylepis.1